MVAVVGQQSSLSAVDRIYRSLVLTKFFTRGWGDPSTIKLFIPLCFSLLSFSRQQRTRFVFLRMLERRGCVADRDHCFGLVPATLLNSIHITKEETDGQLRISTGEFLSPSVHYWPELLPPSCHTAVFQLVSPVKAPSCAVGSPLCIQMAGTGDRHFWRRRHLLAKPLALRHGICSILLENPFYGSRKPSWQRRMRLRGVEGVETEPSDRPVLDGWLFGFGATVAAAMGGVTGLLAARSHRHLNGRTYGLAGCVQLAQAACSHPLFVLDYGVLRVCPGSHVASSSLGLAATADGFRDVSRHSCPVYRFRESFGRRLLVSASFAAHGGEHRSADGFAFVKLAPLSSPSPHAGDTGRKAATTTFATALSQGSNSFLATIFSRIHGHDRSSFSLLQTNKSDAADCVVSQRFRPAALLMHYLMDEFTHLREFSRPVDSRLATWVLAEQDAYVPRDRCDSVIEFWPQAELRTVESVGHVEAFVFGQDSFMSAIVDTLNRTKRLYPNSSSRLI